MKRMKRKISFIKAFISELIENSKKCFNKRILIYHFAALISTFVIIISGFDYQSHNFFVRNTQFQSFSEPAVYIGYFLPVILICGILVYAVLRNSAKGRITASALIQVLIISLILSSALKFITGRPNPEPSEYLNNSYSLIFHFGFNRGGMHYGWPSGHMMTNTAVIICFLYLKKDKIILKVIAGFYLVYLFLSVLSHDQNSMHWFSDAVAGILMGYSIGLKIGKCFYGDYSKNEKTGY